MFSSNFTSSIVSVSNIFTPAVLVLNALRLPILIRIKPCMIWLLPIFASSSYITPPSSLSQYPSHIGYLSVFWRNSGLFQLTAFPLCLGCYWDMPAHPLDPTWAFPDQISTLTPCINNVQHFNSKQLSQLK